MSRLPKVDKKPKNNKDNKFRWVDSQWEKFMDIPMDTQVHKVKKKYNRKKKYKERFDDE